MSSVSSVKYYLSLTLSPLNNGTGEKERYLFCQVDKQEKLCCVLFVSDEPDVET